MHVPILPNFSFENLIDNVCDANCVYGPHTFELNFPTVEVVGCSSIPHGEYRLVLLNGQYEFVKAL